MSSTLPSPGSTPGSDADAQFDTPAPPVLDAPPDRRIQLRLAYSVFLRNRDVFMRLWRWLLVPNIVENAMTMVAIGFGIGSFVNGFGGNYAAFVAPGLVCASAMWSAGFECSYGTFYRMQKQRTFDAIVATPVQVEDVVLGELLYGAFRGMVSATLIAIMFGAIGLFDSWWALLLPLLAALVGFVLATLAVCAVARAPALDSLSYFISFILMPMFWLSGIFYQPDAFGEWVSRVQLVVPMYHAVEVGRELSAGELGWNTLGHVAVLIVIATCFASLAIKLMHGRLVR